MVVKHRDGGYADRHPTGDDVLPVAESSASSLTRDPKPKRPEYAAAGIPDYWVMDLKAESLIVHREPEGRTCRDVQTLTGDTVPQSDALPDFALSVVSVYA